MILECIRYKLGDLSTDERNYIGAYVHLEEVHLVLGRKYGVYGVIQRKGFNWYLVCEDENAAYPKPHFAGFFKVIDSTIPSGWSFQRNSGPWPEGALLPIEWSRPDFYDALLDGGNIEGHIFRVVKAQIESQNDWKK